MPPNRSDLFGKTPGKAFADTNDPFAGTRVAVVTRVDAHNMKCDLRVLTGGGDRYEVDLTQAIAGPRSFLGGIPEVGSLVIVGARRKHKNLHEVVILGYIPVGLTTGLRFDPFSGINPDEVDAEDRVNAQKAYGGTIRYKRIKGQPGDIMGMSASGAEWILSKDVRMINRAGDLFELRDSDRTLVAQAVHQVHSDSGSYFFSGPIRRGLMNLPRDLFEKDKSGAITKKLKPEKASYFGADELAGLGAANAKFANASTRTVIDRINDDEEFPPSTFSNGRQVYYASYRPAEGIETFGSDNNVFVERRVEIRHVTDLTQPVLDEIDGFTTTPYYPYIESVQGTVVGNDAFSSGGQQQYARVLKPRIFDDFHSRVGKFDLEDCIRTPGNATGDEARTMAGAFYWRMTPPTGNPNGPHFVAAVSKQGKLFLNVPGSRVENYQAKNVSAEINMEGALKMKLGAAAPDNISLHLVCEGGIHVEFGADSEGRSITTSYRGTVKNEYKGTNDTDDVAHSEAVQGNSEKSISGNYTKTVQGAVQQKVSGGYNLQASKMGVSALNGYTATLGEYNVTVTGKTQYNYALIKNELIAGGGHLKTVMAGGELTNLLAGAKVTNVAAGAWSTQVGTGAINLTTGLGAMSLSTGAGAVSLATAAGAVAVTAGAGAVAITAGLAVNITAPSVAVNAAQIMLGGPAAVLGVNRGFPAMPPGVPTPDYLFGIPHLGSASVRTI